MATPYAIEHWGAGYYHVDGDHLSVQPQRAGARARLDQIAEQAKAFDLRLPLLVRFPQILADRVQTIDAAFTEAIRDNGYAGSYRLCYPIKVNQRFEVVRAVNEAASGVGLEAGSKPELLAVLSVARPGQLIICNGYKDRDYIALALLGLELGLELYIVLEKLDELALVQQLATELGIRPRLGARLRLSTIASGRWQSSGGERAKFGMGPADLLVLLERLSAAGQLDELELLHFHMGSQIPSLRFVQQGLREAIRIVEAFQDAGASIRCLDIGGGLGVDYEGTRSSSDFSQNYSLEQYAALIVRMLAEAFPVSKQPQIISESGRALTAHHAVLLVDVLQRERAPRGDEDDFSALPAFDQLRKSILTHASPEHLVEARLLFDDAKQAFAHGGISLADRARAERCFYTLADQLVAALDPTRRLDRDALDTLHQLLAEKYFANFSLFRSLPDIWALDQVFPIVPLRGLSRTPDRSAVLEDLTCDSDGTIRRFVTREGISPALPVHAFDSGSRYPLGIFLVGAYQEILGDDHNLFGVTDAVDAMVDQDGALRLVAAEKGDCIEDVLGLVGFTTERVRSALDLKFAELAPDRHGRAQTLIDRTLARFTYLD